MFRSKRDCQFFLLVSQCAVVSRTMVIGKHPARTTHKVGYSSTVRCRFSVGLRYVLLINICLDYITLRGWVDALFPQDVPYEGSAICFCCVGCFSMLSYRELSAICRRLVE